MPKLDAVKHSPHSIFSNTKAARKAYDQAWNNAARAPIFCKIAKKTLPNGKVCLYTLQQPMVCNITKADDCMVRAFSVQKVLPHVALAGLARLYDRGIRCRRCGGQSHGDRMQNGARGGGIGERSRAVDASGVQGRKDGAGAVSVRGRARGDPQST